MKDILLNDFPIVSLASAFLRVIFSPVDKSEVYNRHIRKIMFNPIVMDSKTELSKSRKDFKLLFKNITKSSNRVYKGFGASSVNLFS